MEFNDVDFTKTAGHTTITIYSSYTVHGNLTIHNATDEELIIIGSGSPVITVDNKIKIEDIPPFTGPIYFGNGATLTVKVAGDVELENAYAYMRANLELNGTGTQEITQTGTIIDQGTWVINKNSGTAIQLTHLSIPALTLTKGTYNADTYNLTVSGAYIQPAGTFSGTGTISFGSANLSGGASFTTGAGTLTVSGAYAQSGSSLANIGSGAVSLGSMNLSEEHSTPE